MAWTFTEQDEDGVLDEYGDAVGFGLATADQLANPGTDLGGACSFYYDRPDGILQGYPLDVGIRAEDCPRGGLLVPLAADDPLADAERAAQVEDRVRALIPFGGWYAGPALFDLARLFARDPRLLPRTPDNPVGDSFAACRRRAVILVTDGRTMYDGSWGYPTAAEAAAQLRAGGVELHVVGVAVPAAERAWLDGLAGEPPGARLASDAGTLAEELRDILDALADPSEPPCCVCP